MNFKKIIGILFTFLISFYCCFKIIEIFGNRLIYLPLIAAIIITAYKAPLLYLIIIVIIYEMLFQTILVPIKPWQFVDASILLVFIGFIVQFIKNGFNLKFDKKNYYIRFIFLILLIVYFTIFVGSYLIYNQPINTLLFRPRAFYLYLIFLYLIMADFNTTQIKKIILFIIISSVLVSALVIIDAKLLGGYKIFQYAFLMGVAGERGGAIRIATYSYPIVFAYFYLLSFMRFNRNITWKFIALLGWLIITYQLVFILMTRNLLIMIIMTTGVFLFNLRVLISKTFILCSIGVVILFTTLIFLNNQSLLEKTTYFKMFVETKTRVEKSKSTIELRIDGAKFFFPYFLKTAGLGMGIMSPMSENTPEYEGRNNAKRRYLFADLGFIAIIYRFGIFSIIAVAVILTRIFKDLIFIQKDENIEYQIIANSIIYLFISEIIFLPMSKIFFTDQRCLYYGLLFYIIYKLKSAATINASKNTALLA